MKGLWLQYWSNFIIIKYIAKQVSGGALRSSQRSGWHVDLQMSSKEAESSGTNLQLHPLELTGKFYNEKQSGAHH